MKKLVYMAVIIIVLGGALYYFGGMILNLISTTSDVVVDTTKTIEEEASQTSIWLKIIMVLLPSLFVIAIAVLILANGKIEVGRNEAVVYKNILTGTPHAFVEGINFLIPGLHERLVDVTLKNEPSDPLATQVISADGITLGVDYVIFTQKVVDPIKAATEIEYRKRRELIIDRIKAFLQNQFSGIATEDVFVAKGRSNVMKKEFIKEVEDHINKVDLFQRVEKEWGIRVEIEIENVRLPEKLAEVAEEAATAQKEGERIKAKAKAAGISPVLATIADIFQDVARFRNAKEAK